MVNPTTQVSVEDIQSNSFETKGTITVDKPTDLAGTDPNLPMVVGTNYTIQWTKSGNINNVQVHYSTTGCGAGNNYAANPVIFDGASSVSAASVPPHPNSALMRIAPFLMLFSLVLCLFTAH